MQSSEQLTSAVVCCVSLL